MRNSTTGRNAVVAAAHDVERPAAHLAVAPVHRQPRRDACTCPSASTASPTRTCGSSASSTPPRVKPISGSPLSPDPLLGDGAHLRDQRPRLLGQRDHAERDALLARLVERRAHVLPRLARELRSGRSTRVSSATCTRCQPSARAASAVSSVTENRHGTQPCARTWRRSPHGRRRVRRRPDRVAEADRDARVPLVGDERLAVGGDSSCSPARSSSTTACRRRAAAASARRSPVDRGGRGAAPHAAAATARGTPAPDDEHHEDAVHSSSSATKRGSPSSMSRVPPKIAASTPSTAIGKAERHVEACDDDGEPPGQPLAAAQALGSAGARGPA